MINISPPIIEIGIDEKNGIKNPNGKSEWKPIKTSHKINDNFLATVNGEDVWEIKILDSYENEEGFFVIPQTCVLVSSNEM